MYFFILIYFKIDFRHSEKAFERFLFLLKTFDFENESMILDFQGDLKGLNINYFYKVCLYEISEMCFFKVL